MYTSRPTSPIPPTLPLDPTPPPDNDTVSSFGGDNYGSPRAFNLMLANMLPTVLHFTHPEYLVVLAALPLLALLSRRSLAGLGRWRAPLALGLRCLLVATLVCALAGPEWVRTTDDQTVAFVLDESDSVPPAAQRAALEFMSQATTKMRPGKDRVAALSFAAHPTVDQLPRDTFYATGMTAGTDRYQTDIAAALRLGLALFPTDSAKRLVLLTDGNENRGSAITEADAFAALNIPIDVVPLRYAHDAEILVDQLAAPAHANRGEVVDLQLIVRAQTAAAAHLTLYRNDAVVDLNPDAGQVAFLVTLHPGPNRISIPAELPVAGVYRFRAIVQPDDPAADSIAVNNVGEAFTVVGEATRVAIVTDAGSADRDTAQQSAALLAAALQEGGIACDLLDLDTLPADPAALADTAALILSNVSAIRLGTERQEMLASYVRDQGGGLIVVGGDQAFSVGGYAGTPLEEVLPVQTSRDRLKLLSLAMVIVVDHSGSMAGDKIAMARQAAMGSVNLLSRLDRLGVVTFDSVSNWVVPLQLAENREGIAQQIATIGAGGGTDMAPALQMAYAALANVSANLKHIIVLTDGQSAPGPFDTIASDCAKAGITISTIAVGPDADRQLLAAIAQWSGGRMYVAENAKPLPQIFARETVLASRSGLYERAFTPQLRSAADERILVGFDAAEIPPLRGHVITEAKPLAFAPLVRRTEDGADPILAYWQVGLGRTVAFTSGLWPRWGREWIAWPAFSKLWTQAVRYAARPGTPGDLEVTTSVQGGMAHVSVSAGHLPPLAQGSLAVTGQLVDPAFAATALQLQRTAAGRFEASFPLDAPGTYLLNLPYRVTVGSEQQSGVLRAGLVQSYSPEYRTLHHNEAALAALARRTGGRVLDLQQAGAVFESWSIRPLEVRRPFWEALVRLALALFILDVAVRRIALNPTDAVERARLFVHELGSPRGTAQAAATIGALREVKGRTQTVPPPTSHASLSNGADASDGLTRALNSHAADEAAATPPATARPERPPTADGADDYASRLLRAKRRVQRSEAPPTDD